MQDSLAAAIGGESAEEKQEEPQALGGHAGDGGSAGILEGTQPSNHSGDGNEDLSSEDLELSDDDGVVPGPTAAGSDVDEDWGSWE